MFLDPLRNFNAKELVVAYTSLPFPFADPGDPENGIEIHGTDIDTMKFLASALNFTIK